MLYTMLCLVCSKVACSTGVPRYLDLCNVEGGGGKKKPTNKKI